MGLNEEKNDTYNNISFGKHLKQLRKSRNIDQASLAKALGVKRVTISAYETGKVIPPPDKIKALADTLGMPPESLISKIDSPKSNMGTSNLNDELSSEDIQLSRELLMYYASFSREHQEAIYNLIKALYIDNTAV